MMGLLDLFSGGNSTSSNPVTTNTTTTDLSRIDSRTNEGNAAVSDVQVSGNSGSLTITSTDQGTVRASTDIALESMRGLQSSLNATQSVAKDSISQAYGLANEARQSETSGAINQLVTYVFWIGLAAVAVWGIKSAKKA